jgi:hypothetical protein
MLADDGRWPGISRNFAAEIIGRVCFVMAGVAPSGRFDLVKVAIADALSLALDIDWRSLVSMAIVPEFPTGKFASM